MSSLCSEITLCSSYTSRTRSWNIDSKIGRNSITENIPGDDVFLKWLAMATTSMNLPAAAAQAPTENMVPHTSAVVDWVHQQSQHDEPRNASTMNRRAQMVTPPPYSVRTAGMGREQSLPRRKVYDAVTLLKLRETQSAVPVMLRVKPEAIAGTEIHLDFLPSYQTRLTPSWQRTSSSTWQQTAHAVCPHALAVFPRSQTSLEEVSVTTTTTIITTPLIHRQDRHPLDTRFVNQ